MKHPCRQKAFHNALAENICLARVSSIPRLEQTKALAYTRGLAEPIPLPMWMKIFALRCIVNAQGTLVGSLHPYATETIDGFFVNGAIRRVSMTLLVFLPIFARDLCLPPFHVFFQTMIVYRRTGVFPFAHSPTNRFSVWTGRKRTELLANLAVDGRPCFFIHFTSITSALSLIKRRWENELWITLRLWFYNCTLSLYNDK